LEALPDDTVVAVIVTDVPEDSGLIGGYELGRGAWAIRPDSIDDLGIVAAPEAEDAFAANVTVLLRDPTDAPKLVSRTGELVLSPPASVRVGEGDEHRVVSLDLAGLVGSLLTGRALYDLTVSGLPDSATLTRGEANDDGSWSLTARDLRAGPVAIELPGTWCGRILLSCAALTIGSQGDLEQRTRWTTVEVKEGTPG
jgi:hypothetical protein